MTSPFSWSFTTVGPTCPCSIWQNGTPSGAVDANDTSAVNLGLKFHASASGFISAVRFYKESDNTGTHIGSLWSSTGTLLASGTFSNETASGWQELDFSTPVAVTAGTTYVASYHTNAGHYAPDLERTGVGGHQRTADRAGQRRRLRLRLGQRLPLEHVPGLQLLGRRRCTRRPRAPRHRR